MTTHSLFWLFGTLKCVICAAGVALAAAVVVIIGLAAGLGVEKSKSSPSSSDDVCMSPSCVELSQQILASLDDSIDPCDDVYKFACNRFVQNAIIPDGEYIVRITQEA